MIGTELKSCRQCGANKPLTEFPLIASKHLAKCGDCKRADEREWYLRHREARCRKVREYAQSKKDCPVFVKSRRAAYQKYIAQNAELEKERLRKWRKDNWEKCLAKSAAWKRNNPKKRCATEAKRRATKLQRTPKWADLEKIKEIYVNCPPGFHVDHVIPLKGEDVCGLHVETNLQYLTAAENLRKSNNFELTTTAQEAQST